MFRARVGVRGLRAAAGVAFTTSLLTGFGIVGLVDAGVASAGTSASVACAMGTCTATFTATGSVQSFTVPAGVSSLMITVEGAAARPLGNAGAVNGGMSTGTLATRFGTNYEVLAGALGSRGSAAVRVLRVALRSVGAVVLAGPPPTTDPTCLSAEVVEAADRSCSTPQASRCWWPAEPAEMPEVYAWVVWGAASAPLQPAEEGSVPATIRPAMEVVAPAPPAPRVRPGLVEAAGRRVLPGRDQQRSACRAAAATEARGARRQVRVPPAVVVAVAGTTAVAAAAAALFTAGTLVVPVAAGLGSPTPL